MATKNIVPRATGEGGIGTALKRWLKGFFNSLDVANGANAPVNTLQRSTAYALNDVAFYSGIDAKYFLKCTTAGTTGAALPDFTGVTSDSTVTDGTVVWTVKTLGNEEAFGNYLPLSGGTMTGEIGGNIVSFRLKNETSGNNCNSMLMGGNDSNNGAYFQAHGKASNGGAGFFNIVANDGTNSKMLQGRPDGTLKWDENAIALAKDYLPLSGGTMTGDISANKSTFVIQNRYANDKGSVLVEASNNSYASAQLTLNATNTSNTKGGFILASTDGTQYFKLIGRQDGTLKWKEQNILTSSNYNSYALPLSGGTMTGDVVFNYNFARLKKHDDSGEINLQGATNWNKGAVLTLYGKDSTNAEAGGFVLGTHNGTVGVSLKGKPDGTLTWNGQPILPVGIVQAFAGTTIPNGWLLCDGSAVRRTTYANLYTCIGDTYGAGDGSTTFNLPDLSGESMSHIIKY